MSLHEIEFLTQNLFSAVPKKRVTFVFLNNDQQSVSRSSFNGSPCGIRQAFFVGKEFHILVKTLDHKIQLPQTRLSNILSSLFSCDILCSRRPSMRFITRISVLVCLIMDSVDLFCRCLWSCVFTNVLLCGRSFHQS